MKYGQQVSKKAPKTKTKLKLSYIIIKLEVYQKIKKNKNYKMCLWNTMPPIIANSNDGQDHKEKYFDTSRKILSQEMTNVIFLSGQMSRSND